MNANDRSLVDARVASDVDSFLDTLHKTPVHANAARGRLIFALDATASRQPTWDRAAHLQAEMFMAAASVGGLQIQLCFYRGYGEFRVGPWSGCADALVRMMTTVTCRAGETQIRKVLQHTLNVSLEQRAAAMVFVGDSIEEALDPLGTIAGKLGTLGVPAFMFHEGRDARAAFAFAEIARLSGGACCSFDADSADALRRLLCAVAVYAAGGKQALDRLAQTSAADVRLLAQQLRSG